MIVKIRKWELSDAKDLALALSSKEIQNNLRDGLPYLTPSRMEKLISLLCFLQMKMKPLLLLLQQTIK